MARELAFLCESGSVVSPKDRGTPTVGLIQNVSILPAIPMVMSRRFVSGCTHLVTGSASPTTQILEALIAAAPLVTSAYVDVLVKRGNLNLSEPGSLQAKLDLPDEAEYFPEQATVEGMTVEEVKEAFAPKPERKMLLEGTTFLVATRNEMVDRVREMCITCSQPG